MHLRAILLTLLPALAKAAIGDACSSPSGDPGTCQERASCTAGYTVIGACPNDAEIVRCCIPKSCSIDNLTGTCLDKTQTACSGGAFQPGLCPGSNDMQCCLLDASDTPAPTPPDPIESNELAKYLRTLHGHALEFGADNTRANQLAMEWLRHESYNDYKWAAVLGYCDDDFLAFVRGKGTSMMRTFHDAPSGLDVETDHLFATMNGHFVEGTNGKGDTTGWAGDLFTFYGEWRAPAPWNIEDGDEFCRKNLAQSKGTFKLMDMVQDADGYNIAMTLRGDRALTIYDVVAAYYPGRAERRFTELLEGRFGGRDGARETALGRLTELGDPILFAARTALVQMTAGLWPVRQPTALDDDEIGPFVDGFADRLSELADTE